MCSVVLGHQRDVWRRSRSITHSKSSLKYRYIVKIFRILCYSLKSMEKDIQGCFWNIDDICYMAQRILGRANWIIRSHVNKMFLHRTFNVYSQRDRTGEPATITLRTKSEKASEAGVRAEFQRRTCARPTDGGCEEAEEIVRCVSDLWKALFHTHS